MAKKRKDNRDLYASLDADDRTFTRIYPGMIKSQAYQNLSLGAKHFYVLCRCQAASKEGRQVLFNHGREYGIRYDENDFVFPASHLEKFGIRRENSWRYFKELKEGGFIEKKEGNKPLKRVNVYSFSTRWKHSSVHTSDDNT